MRDEDKEAASDKERLDTEDPEAVTRLLCCVCQDQNTTFRYEVVYKQADRSITILDLTPANREELRGLTEDSDTRPESLEDSSETAEYYNFPPKHPRHGHLKWPVWRPAQSSSKTPEESTVTSSSLVSSSASYPDHPIHIPTFTLQRINNLLSSKARRGNTVTITPCHGPHSIMVTGDYPSLSSAQCDVPRLRRPDHRHGS